jgi:tetratricopeptide (TPR) repeat protein
MSKQLPISPQLARFLEYIRSDAGNLALRRDAIRMACDEGHWEVARQLLNDAPAGHAQDGELLALHGFVLLQAQRYVDAEQALSSAIATGVEAAAVGYNLAFAVFMQKRYEAALEILSAPAALQTGPLASLLRARCLHHVGRRAEAAEDCNAYLAAVPDDVQGRGLLALILYEQGHAGPAREHADVALQGDPHQLEALLTVASMQADSSDASAARGSFQALTRIHPHCGRAWFGLALIELSETRVDEAAKSIALAAAQMPEHIGTWHVMAWAALMKGDIAAAAGAFDTALAIDRSFGETHGGLAIIAACRGEEEEARRSIRRARRLDPNAMSPYYAELLLLQRHGREAEARELLDAVLARPTARGDTRYVDLVAAHMRRLRTEGAAAPPPRYH